MSRKTLSVALVCLGSAHRASLNTPIGNDIQGFFGEGREVILPPHFCVLEVKMTNLNQSGLNLIKTFEGLKLTAYRDPAGIWTIGWGHTGNDVHEGLIITADEAEALLREDLIEAISTVKSAVGSKPTSDNQFAAMVSLCFNIGSGNVTSGFWQSSVLKYHNAGAYEKAGAAFLLWDKIHLGSKLISSAGLARRRRAEQALYLSPDEPAAQYPTA